MIGNGLTSILDALTFAQGSPIASIQSGLATFENETASGQRVSIAPVDLSRSIVMVRTVGGGVYSYHRPDRMAVRARFLDESTIVFNRARRDFEIDVYWVVIEFSEGVNVQFVSGTIYGDSTSRTVQIAPVNLERTLVYVSWESLEDSTQLGRYILRTPWPEFVDAETLMVRVDGTASANDKDLLFYAFIVEVI